MPSLTSFPSNCGAVAIIGIGSCNIMTFVKCYADSYSKYTAYKPSLVAFSDSVFLDKREVGGCAIARDLVHYGHVAASEQTNGNHGTPIQGWLWNPSKKWIEAGMPLDWHIPEDQRKKPEPPLIPEEKLTWTPSPALIQTQPAVALGAAPPAAVGWDEIAPAPNRPYDVSLQAALSQSNRRDLPAADIRKRAEKNSGAKRRTVRKSLGSNSVSVPVKKRIRKKGIL